MSGEPQKLEITDELIAERRGDPSGELPDDMPGWMAKTITRIDLFSLWVGRVVCWLTLPLFSSMAYEVIAGFAAADPLQDQMRIYPFVRDRRDL